MLAACVDSWQFTVIGIGALFVVAMVIRTALALNEIRESRTAIDAGLALTCAEQHALDYATHVGCAAERELGGFVSRIETIGDGDARRLRIEVQSTLGMRGERHFECDVLPGSLPIALRRPFTVFGAVSGSLRSEHDFMTTTAARGNPAAPPRISPPTLNIGAVPHTETSIAGRGAFVRDDALALLWLSGGTDQLDYRLQAGRDGVARLRFGPSGVLVVDGNLWIVGDDRPLEIAVERQVTLVVRGNLYLDRGVVVRGHGGLMVFVENAARSDWVEGSGRLLLGLPRARTQHAAMLAANSSGDGAIGCDLSLVVRDDTSVNRSFEIGGALVVGGNLVIADTAELLVTGRRLPDVRAPQPGVQPVGEPLPSRLREVRARH